MESLIILQCILFFEKLDAQDDWNRWETGGQTTSSDLSGHEIRSVFRATPKLDIVARLYVVDAMTSEQDGMRFRIDFNYKF